MQPVQLVPDDTSTSKAKYRVNGTEFEYRFDCIHTKQKYRIHIFEAMNLVVILREELSITGRPQEKVLADR